MSDKPNDVRSTSVSITLNAKQFGVDAFIKLEQTNEFPELVSEVDALVKREEIAALLTEQVLAIAEDTAKTITRELGNRAPAPAPAAAGTYAPAGTGADAIRAVANGASYDSDWRVAPDSWDNTKQVRFLSTNAYTAEQMKAAGSQWLSDKGLNAEAFDIWDERRDGEAGKPISSVCNVKVKESFQANFPQDLIKTPKGGNKALIRAKFNSDGSLYFYWANKEIEAAFKYGAFSSVVA
jgi:hypothetical protein